MLLQDTTLMLWIRSEPDKKKQRERLAMKIGEAITSHSLEVKSAICCRPNVSIDQIFLRRMNDNPTLVTEKIDGERAPPNKAVRLPGLWNYQTQSARPGTQNLSPGRQEPPETPQPAI